MNATPQAIKQLLIGPDALDEPNYAERRTKFLESLGGWDNVELEPLKADASLRRYWRVHGGPRPAMVQDAILELSEPIEDFVKVGRALKEEGFSAPEIIAVDFDEKIALLEDFGTGMFPELLADETKRKDLYKLAIETLVEMQKNQRFVNMGLPPCDRQTLLGFVKQFIDWYFPVKTGTQLKQAEKDEFIYIWDDIIQSLPDLPPCIVHFDYMPDNLMYLEGRKGIQACGVIDFQKAMVGLPPYDLAMMLQEARRDTEQDLRDEMFDYYLSLRPELDREEFTRAYHILAGNQQTRILGTFTRLYMRDNKPKYLAFMPHLTDLWLKTMSHEPFAPLMKWLDEKGLDATTPFPSQEELDQMKKQA